MTLADQSPGRRPRACRARSRSCDRAGDEDARSGELLEVLATDPGSVKDFAAWSRATGNPLVEQSVDGGVYRFVLRKK